MTKFRYLFLTGVSLLISTPAIHGQQSNIARDMPRQWQYQPEYAQPSPSEDSWWKQYNDPTLDTLIAKAEKNNYNVGAALKRIKLAERQLTAVRATLYPSVEASAGWNANQTSGAMTSPMTTAHRSSYFNAGVSVNWEIDVFGRVAAKTKAAKAGIGVSRAEYDAVMVALCADVASAYFQLRTYQELYRVAIAHIESQEKVVKMTQVRYEAGLSNALEMSQAKTILYSTRASLPTLESSIRTTINSIAILTGEYPSGELSDMLGTSKLAPAPPIFLPRKHLSNCCAVGLTLLKPRSNSPNMQLK